MGLKREMAYFARVSKRGCGGVCFALFFLLMPLWLAGSLWELREREGARPCSLDYLAPFFAGFLSLLRANELALASEPRKRGKGRGWCRGKGASKRNWRINTNG